MSSSTNSSSKQVAAQSLLDPKHHSPFRFNSSDPLVLFIVQAVIIITLCNILGVFLKRIRQPKVISEVIAGILLGPTAFGRIPHFTNSIFPKESIPFLSLVANIGLVLFLFIIGLEVDFKLFQKNFKLAASIGLFGLIFPFGIGALISIGLYKNFVDQDAVTFGHFLLFISVAFAITAFPVLCRILTEGKLLQTDVGIATLAAGVANDVIGWVLLALAVTLVNSGAGLTALYVMLVVLGWVLFLGFIIRPIFFILARRSGSFESGPTPGITCLVLLMTFGSAWFTQVIGVHAIFGGFLVGVIMPHEGGFATILASKIEDLVTVFFLPLYFTLSGLSTDLGLLKDGSIWGWTVCVVLAAEISKFAPSFLAAMLNGMDWRESGAVGSLMACKGLVELIVLNIARDAGVLNSSVFAMFILMAVVTTFVTTPLCLAFYPESYRIAKRLRNLDQKSGSTGPVLPGNQPLNFLMVLSQLAHLPSAMAFVKMLCNGPRHNHEAANPLSPSSPAGGDHAASALETRHLLNPPQYQVSVLRLLELSQRTSDMMKASQVEETAKYDSILNVFYTFASLNGVGVPSAKMSIVPTEEFSAEISDRASRLSSQFIILPWHTNLDRMPQMDGSSVNPFEKMLSGSIDSSPQYANLIRSVCRHATCDVGILVDPSSVRHFQDNENTTIAEQRLFCAFLGGPDDRATLSLVIQLFRRSQAATVILRVIRTSQCARDEAGIEMGDADKSALEGSVDTINVRPSLPPMSDTLYEKRSAAGGMASVTADQALWDQVVELSRQYPGQLKVKEIKSATPFQTVVNQVKDLDEVGLMVFSGRSRTGGESHSVELGTYLKQLSGLGNSSAGGGWDSAVGDMMSHEVVQRLGIVASLDVRKSLGDLTSGLVASGLKAKIMVVQSKSIKDHRRLEGSVADKDTER